MTFIATLIVLCIILFLAVIGEIECDSIVLASTYHPIRMKRVWYKIKLDWWAVFSINSIQYCTLKRDTRLSIEIYHILIVDIFQSSLPQFCVCKLNKRTSAERWKARSHLRREWTEYFLETIRFKFTFHLIVTKICPSYSWDLYNEKKWSLSLIWFHPEIISFGYVMICSLYHYCELRPDETLLHWKPPPGHPSITQVVTKQIGVIVWMNNLNPLIIPPKWI